MNMRLVRPDVLVDVGRLPELEHIRVLADKVTLGACTTHAQIERSSELSAVLSLLPHAARHIAHPQIRSRGTVGGSLAHADPSAEWPTVFCALDARLHAESEAGGTRWIAAREFFRGFLATALEPDELLTEIEIRRPGPHIRWAFHEAAPQAGAFATVMVCALGSANADGEVRGISVTVGGCGGTPHTFPDRELGLGGESLAAELVTRAADAVASGIEPLSDIHASSADRREMVHTLVERALYEIGGDGTGSG
jgi:carbon-monoxide dehydrogenase medium subunit